MAQGFPDPYSALAGGLSQGMQLGQQRQQMKMMQTQQNIENAYKQMQVASSMLTSKGIPPEAKKAMFGSLIKSYNWAYKLIDPNAQPIPEEVEYSDIYDDAIKGISSAFKEHASGKMDDKTLIQSLQGWFNKGRQTGTMEEETIKAFSTEAMAQIERNKQESLNQLSSLFYQAEGMKYSGTQEPVRKDIIAQMTGIDRDAAAKIQRETNIGSNVSDARLYAIMMSSDDPEQQAWAKQLLSYRRSQAPEMYSTTGAKRRAEIETAAPLQEAGETGKQIGEHNMKQYESANSALDQIDKIDELIKHIGSSKAITGMGAEMLLNLERAQAWFGSESATRKVADTEVLDVMMGSEVFPLIKSLGVGARGMDTPAEREFMRKVLTGSIELNKQTLMKMAQIRKSVAQRAIEKWNDRVKKGELDSFFRNTGITKQKLNYDNQKPSGGGGTKKSRYSKYGIVE